MLPARSQLLAALQSTIGCASKTGGRNEHVKHQSAMTTILGIETSCDETAAAIVSGHAGATPDGRIVSNIVYSQIDDHAPYGGVVPELAARAHVDKLDGIVMAALQEANVTLEDIDAIAATTGPGLGGGLIVGTMTAKALAMVTGKPFIAINHLEGHALTARLSDGLAFPYLLLLVSGGHTQIIAVHGLGHYERYATTIDDALGEAFDKTAKLLGLPYPGGPQVEKQASRGDAKRFDLPRPLRGAARPDFSFSGLKTAIRQAATACQPLTQGDVDDICASFQRAVTETLSERIAVSMKRFAEAYPDADRTLVIAGGVAANQAVRSALDALCADFDFALSAPPMALCTDNAAMIAWAGLEHFEAGAYSGLDAPIRTRWPLDENAEALIGSGKRGAKA